jgi:signal transduction histidine kinase
MIQQSINELRTMSYLLHPPFLDEAGLKLALPHYVDGLRQRSGLAIDLDICPTIDRQPSEVELALFRVVQEALTNVTRHSGSPTAHIGLTRGIARGQDCVILTVEDGGRGVSGLSGLPALKGRTLGAPGVGLASMRERLHQIGGWLEVDSSIGGTLVTATVPASGLAAPQAMQSVGATWGQARKPV